MISEQHLEQALHITTEQLQQDQGMKGDRVIIIRTSLSMRLPLCSEHPQDTSPKMINITCKCAGYTTHLYIQTDSYTIARGLLCVNTL